MAQQKFNFLERRAIWEAHGKRCAYCAEPLSFARLEIDHILPEALVKDSDRFISVRKEQGLPVEFDLGGYQNLQPSCRACNARKSAEPLSPGRTAIELAIASRTKGRIEELIERFKREDRKDRLRFAVAGALESGELSEHDLGHVITAARVNSGIFRLSATFQFFGEESVREISQATYERYLDVNLSLPSEMHKGLRLVAHDEREVRVLTLRQFQEARANGFYALSNFEMQVAHQSFERPLAILHILQTAGLAEQSFMDEPRVGLADISLLPATLLFVTEDMTRDPNFAGQRERLEGKSIQKMVSIGEAKVIDVASDLLRVEYNQGRTFMFEIMRADMNGDGVQDMMIHWGAGPVGGTYRTASVAVLTRRSHEEMFSII